MADDLDTSKDALLRSGLPDVIDQQKVSIARLYDFMLGGKENFEVDRKACEAMFRAVPETSQIALDNRALLRRSIRWLTTEAGIKQFIDLGSGLPTEGNVHEIAHEAMPEAKVVYVDKDPIVLAHARALLSDDHTTTVVQADVRDMSSVFDDPNLLALIDYDQPLAVIASGVLHHFDDDTALTIACAIKDKLSPGSYTVITNFLDDDEPRAKELEKAFMHGGLGTGRFRTWAELQEFYEGLELVEPGLVYANEWHPDDATPTNSPVHTLYAGGIGRKPE